MVIKKEGSRWVVRSKKGRKLGSHGTKKEALAQLRAVEASKARRKGR